MLKGSCLCGNVQYEVDGPIENLSHCHCVQCQKAHGAAFGTYARVAKAAFRFVRGEDDVGLYRSSKNVTRTFCSLCGATLQFIDGNTPELNFTLGTLDDAIDDVVDIEIWCCEQASWYDRSTPMTSYRKGQ